MPETDSTGAGALAEKIRVSIEQHCFAVADRITVSIGVAGFSADDSDMSLIKKTDNALYTAKKRGRNRVETDS